MRCWCTSASWPVMENDDIRILCLKLLFQYGDEKGK